MQALLLIPVYILIVLIDIPLITPKMNGNRIFIVIYGIIILSGFAISAFLILDIPPVSPTKVIESIIKGIIGEV